MSKSCLAEKYSNGHTYCEKTYEKYLQVKRNIRYLDMNVQGKNKK